MIKSLARQVSFTWICKEKAGNNLNAHGIESEKIGEVEALLQSLFRQTEEKNGKNKVLGECVLRFIEKPEIIIKDNGALFQPDIQDDRLSYNALLSCNSSTIHLS